MVTVFLGKTMIGNEQDKSIYRSAGYAALIERYDRR